MTYLQFNRLCEKQNTTNHLLVDIYDILGTISENLEQMRNKQTDGQEAKEAFDDMLGNPMKQIDVLRDSIERNKDPERFVRWLDDFSERTAG